MKKNNNCGRNSIMYQVIEIEKLNGIQNFLECQYMEVFQRTYKILREDYKYLWYDIRNNSGRLTFIRQYGNSLPTMKNHPFEIIKKWINEQNIKQEEYINIEIFGNGFRFEVFTDLTENYPDSDFSELWEEYETLNKQMEDLKQQMRKESGRCPRADENGNCNCYEVTDYGECGYYHKCNFYNKTIYNIENCPVIPREY